MLSRVFQAFEDLRALRQYCARKVARACETERLFGSALWKPDESGIQRWRRLTEMIKTSWIVLDQTVRTNRLDPTQYQEAYRQLLGVREVWVHLNRQAAALERLDQVTDCLRQLLIGYAQVREQRARPQL